MEATLPNALKRGLDLLAALAGKDDGLSFTECCSVTMAPENSCARLLQGLCASAWLEKNEDGRYRLGPQAEKVFVPPDPIRRLREECRPVLMSLQERVHNTCLCIAWHKPAMICIDRVLDDNSVPLQTPGRMADNHDSPPWGWFFMGRQHWRKGKRSPNPLRVDIHAELDRLARDGFTYDPQADRRRMASPIHGRDGQIIGALAIGGSEHSLPDAKVTQFGKWLATHAKGLSALM